MSAVEIEFQSLVFKTSELLFESVSPKFVCVFVYFVYVFLKNLYKNVVSKKRLKNVSNSEIV